MVKTGYILLELPLFRFSVSYDIFCLITKVGFIDYSPTQVFIAINTTEVGVETFSETRNSKLRIEKEQISTPLPVIAEKIPPRKPVRDKTPACQIPNIGIESNVILLCCLK